MKKVISILLTAILLLSLTACGDTAPDSLVPAVTTTAAAKSTAASSATATTAATTEAGDTTTEAAGTTTTVAATTVTTTAAATTTVTTADTTTTAKTVDLGGWTMKNIVIFGDSISTFSGYSDEGGAYYSENNVKNNVNRVTDTWWNRMAKQYKLNVLQNNSFSGTTIGYTGYEGANVKDTSFITRLQKQVNANFFEQNNVDTIFVFGGTNDSWSGAPVGEVKYRGIKEEDLFKVLPACCYFMNELKKALPNGKIVWVINSGLNFDIVSGMEAACAKYGITCVTLQNIQTQDGHPDVKGMRQIHEQIVAVLDKELPGWNG